MLKSPLSPPSDGCRCPVTFSRSPDGGGPTPLSPFAAAGGRRASMAAAAAAAALPGARWPKSSWGRVRVAGSAGCGRSQHSFCFTVTTKARAA